MAEVLHVFDTVTLTGPDGRLYQAQACGAPNGNGLWQGWIEFTSTDASAAVRTARETTQPNRTDLLYWASGLTPVYLDGALRRALNPTRVKTVAEATPFFDGPAPAVVVESTAPAPEPPVAVLDPYSVYAKGEDLLRQELRALAPWHLVNIIEAYDLSTRTPAELRTASRQELAELIVAEVAAHAAAQPAVERGK